MKELEKAGDLKKIEGLEKAEGLEKIEGLEQKVQKICKHAGVWERATGPAIMCKEKLGDNYDHKGTCICTEYLRSGLIQIKAKNSLNKMLKCGYRIP